MFRFLSLIMMSMLVLVSPLTSQTTPTPVTTDALDFAGNIRSELRLKEYARYPAPMPKDMAVRNVKRKFLLAFLDQAPNELPLITMKTTLSDNYPSTNAVTQSWFTAAGFTATTSTNELRYMLALMREFQSQWGNLDTLIQSWFRIYGQSRHGSWHDASGTGSIAATGLANLMYRRASYMAESIAYLEDNGMSDLAQDVDFVRDVGMVKAGDSDGFTLTSGSDALKLTTWHGATPKHFAASTAVTMRYAERIGVGTQWGQPATIISPVPVYLTEGTGKRTLLPANTSRTLAVESLKLGFKAEAMQKPRLKVRPISITAQSNGRLTLPIVDLFSGQELQVTTMPSDRRLSASIANGVITLTVEQRASTAITITATNQAGSASVSFQVYGYRE